MVDENPFAALFGKKPSGTIATLARLAPGGPTDAINITLATLDPATSAPYDCISYDRSQKWETVNITVDGKPMHISQPLRDALHSSRHARDTVLLWADLLTGSSAEERSKSAQVSKEVLQNARIVTCFLGNGSARSAEIYKVLQTLANWYRQASLAANMPEKMSMATLRNMDDMRTSLSSRNMSEIKIQDEKLWQEIDDIFCSTYFKSAQAITDIILGKNVVVRSGAGSMSWEDFNLAKRATLFILPSQGKVISARAAESFQIISSIEIAVRRALKGESLELLPMMQSARDGATSADPREYVFAMLPVVSPSDRVKAHNYKPPPMPVVDYTKTTEQVFTEASKYIIEERQDLLIWWNQLPPCRQKTSGLPSFVPDWATPVHKSLTVRNPDNGLRRWWETVTSRKRIYIDDESHLHVQAHALDRIESVSAVFTPENFRRIILQMWQSGKLIPGQPREQTMDNYWRAVVLDTDAAFGERMRDNKKPGKEIMASWQSLICEELILHTLGCTMEELNTSPALQARARTDQACIDMGPATGKSAAIEELIKRNSMGRRMFRTTSGKMGMTAIEGSDTKDNSDGPRAPNFDDPLSDALGRSMMDAFQSFLAQRDPAAARVAAQALQGDLPGQRRPGVRSGDLVVALVGGFEPYVLRPVQPETLELGDLRAEAKYAFVGDCHLQGAMEGEGLVDPQDLYGRWKRVELVDVLIV